MKKNNQSPGLTSKYVAAWGIRRKEVDVHQLALAYYLLARKRVEARRAASDGDPASDDERGRAA